MTTPTTFPFSFREIQDAQNGGKPPEPPDHIKASDSVELAVRVYRPTKEPPRAALVFYHGGGAHSGAGYQAIGRGLCEDYGMSVYMPDLRGHGASSGPRGDAPSSEQVLRDVSTVIELVRNKESSIPLFLGGHSSGGGLVVNYASWSDRLLTEGYVLISPQLGYKSDTSRPSSSQAKFASVSIGTFILNGIFGVLGHSKAVRFNYPAEVLAEDKGMVSYNTVNMANAITPDSPNDQISSIDLPIGIWVGSDDELFVAAAVAKFAKNIRAPGKGTCGTVVPRENHLSIIVRAHEFIGPDRKSVV